MQNDTTCREQPYPHPAVVAPRQQQLCLKPFGVSHLERSRAYLLCGVHHSDFGQVLSPQRFNRLLVGVELSPNEQVSLVRPFVFHIQGLGVHGKGLYLSVGGMYPVVGVGDFVSPEMLLEESHRLPSSYRRDECNSGVGLRRRVETDMPPVLRDYLDLISGDAEPVANFAQRGARFDIHVQRFTDIQLRQILSQGSKNAHIYFHSKSLLRDTQGYGEHGVLSRKALCSPCLSARKTQRCVLSVNRRLRVKRESRRGYSPRLLWGSNRELTRVPRHKPGRALRRGHPRRCCEAAAVRGA